MNEYLTVKDLPTSERPYEKCERFGAAVLTDAELLAVIIRSGTKNERSTELASRILKKSSGAQSLSFLYHVNMNELMKIKGIGKVKAIQLLCVAELSKRISAQVKGDRIAFNDADETAAYFMEDMRHQECELLRLVMLNSKNGLIADRVMFKGTVGMAPMEPRELLREALRNDAVSIMILHNHPSGDPTPSNQDIQSTVRLNEACRQIGIRLLDHLVIGDNRFVSMKRSGLF